MRAGREPYAYLTLPASTLARVLLEAALMGVDPLWLLADMAAAMVDASTPGGL